MTGALLILAVMIVAGLLLYITDVKYFRHHHNEVNVGNGEDGPQIKENENEVCCGQHLICEKTSLAVTTDEIIYYDDEELDRFKGRSPQSYTASETEEFRDVLLTLLPEDVAGWARSITLRGIELPYDVKDELLMLVSEMRG